MKKYFYTFSILVIAIFTFCIVNSVTSNKTINTSATTIDSLSSKKIEW